MRACKASVFKDARWNRPWIVRWSEPTEAGKRVRKSKSFSRQRDAQSFAAKKTRELRGELCEAAEETREGPSGLGDKPLSAFVDMYRQRRKAEGLRAATLELFRDNLSRLVSYFGPARTIGSMTTDELSRFLADQRIVAKGRFDQPLAKSSRNGIVRALRTMFSFAQDWGYVTKSPMIGIRMLKINEDDRRGWNYFSPRDIRALLRAAPTLREKALYALAYGTGLRFGELFALRPENVDLVAGYVRVRSHEGADCTPPFHIKDHERRSVPLPSYAGKLVSGWMRQRAQGSPHLFIVPERYAAVRARWRKMRVRGEQWQNRFLVNNVVRELKRHAKRAAIAQDGPITIHSLRKSYGKNGSRYLSAEVLKEYMGHSDIATTLTYYSKRDADDDAHARRVLDRLLKGKPVQNLMLSDVEVTSERASRRDPHALESTIGIVSSLSTKA